MDETTRPGRASHVVALDSVRGLAALAVVFHHVWLLGLLQPTSPWEWRLLRYSPLRVVVEGRAPVILFFVLSGFVLAQGLLQRRSTVPVFLMRRLTRIYPPFAAAILLSAALYAWFEPGADRPLGAWFAAFWQHGHGMGVLARHLLMLGTARDDLDPVVWSLIHELRISALLPLLLWIGARHLWLLGAASLALQFLAVSYAVDAGTGRACLSWATCRPFWGTTLPGSLLVSLYFVVFFVLGLGIARHRPRLRAWLARLGGQGRLALLALASALLAGIPFAHDLAYGIGAALLLALVLEAGAGARTLRHPGLVWLGRISYSLYLIHLPVFLAVIYGLPAVPLGARVALLVPLSLLAAAVLHRAVEGPAQALGRRLAERAAGGVDQSAAARASSSARA